MGCKPCGELAIARSTAEMPVAEERRLAPFANLTPELRQAIGDDRVGRVLRWVLLFTAAACFAMIAWATQQTYRGVPPTPNSFVGTNGQLLAIGADIVAGEFGFQKADLMDYGSVCSMGLISGPTTLPRA